MKTQKIIAIALIILGILGLLLTLILPSSEIVIYVTISISLPLILAGIILLFSIWGTIPIFLEILLNLGMLTFRTTPLLNLIWMNDYNGPISIGLVLIGIIYAMIEAQTKSKKK